MLDILELRLQQESVLMPISWSVTEILRVMWTFTVKTGRLAVRLHYLDLIIIVKRKGKSDTNYSLN